MEKSARGNTWNDAISEEGEFVRDATEFHHRIGSGDGEHPPAPERYHLYVSFACPWAHRTLIVRALKGLEDVVGVSVVHPLLDSSGWHFGGRRRAPMLSEDVPGAASFDESTRDELYGATLLREIYDRSVGSGQYKGRITVPVLWDKERETIVNNESAEIIRFLNSEFNAFAKNPDLDLYPTELRREIDDLNAWVYPAINNGVYRCGFATKQMAYEKAFDELFAGLERAEVILSQQRYLVGDRFTEADVRLFTTLVRFDAVYHNHFRCNLRKLREYPNLWNYLLDIAQMPGVANTIRLDHIKFHYYASHTSINPTRIVPKGPELDFAGPHDRRRFR